MLGAAAPYLVAIFAMLLAGVSALTLVYVVRHLDPRDEAPPESAAEHKKVAV
jgi:hypothetical protein